MVSSPLIVMGVLAIAVTIGYLGISNYQLRQEGLEAAKLAERNDISLDESVDECRKNLKDLKEKIQGTQDAVNQISGEKGRIEEEKKKKEEEGNAALFTADQEHEKVFIELEEVEIKKANLTNRLYELTGQTPSAEEGSFSSDNFEQQSSTADDYSDDEEEEKDGA